MSAKKSSYELGVHCHFLLYFTKYTNPEPLRDVTLVHQHFDVKCELLGFIMSMFLRNHTQELISKMKFVIYSVNLYQSWNFKSYTPSNSAYKSAYPEYLGDIH